MSIALLFDIGVPFKYCSCMNKRKPPTKEEIAAADRLRIIWERKKVELRLTQEAALISLGLGTQGAVSHYLNKQTPINLGMLIKFSRLLKVSASDIYPEMAEEYLSGYVDFLDETEKQVVQLTRQVSVSDRAEIMRKIDLEYKTKTLNKTHKLPLGIKKERRNAERRRT